MACFYKELVSSRLPLGCRRWHWCSQARVSNFWGSFHRTISFLFTSSISWIKRKEFGLITLQP